MGYAIIDNEEMKLAPFIGEGGFGILPKHKNDSLGNDYSNLTGKGILYYGFNIDYRFGYLDICKKPRGWDKQSDFC